MSIRTSLKLTFSLIGLLLIGCIDSEYSKMVKSEMEKDIINDSLFLGLKLGQTQKEFFNICWKLNQEKVVINGDDMFVRYKLPNNDKKSEVDDMTMLFYGNFNDKKEMTGMKLRFYYEAWSIWNEKLQADQLAFAVKDSLLAWYPGNDFIKVALEESEKELWVKVDGNRRITIKPVDDEKVVRAQIDDLRYVFKENE